MYIEMIKRQYSEPGSKLVDLEGGDYQDWPPKLKRENEKLVMLSRHHKIQYRAFYRPKISDYNKETNTMTFDLNKFSAFLSHFITSVGYDHSKGRIVIYF